MAVTALAVIKNWFKKGKYPTEQQFSDTWDSFRHLDEKIKAIDLLLKVNGISPNAEGNIKFAKEDIDGLKRTDEPVFNQLTAETIHASDIIDTYDGAVALSQNEYKVELGNPYKVTSVRGTNMVLDAEEQVEVRAPNLDVAINTLCKAYVENMKLTSYGEVDYDLNRFTLKCSTDFNVKADYVTVDAWDLVQVKAQQVETTTSDFFRVKTNYFEATTTGDFVVNSSYTRVNAINEFQVKAQGVYLDAFKVDLGKEGYSRLFLDYDTASTRLEGDHIEIGNAGYAALVLDYQAETTTIYGSVTDLASVHTLLHGGIHKDQALMLGDYGELKAQTKEEYKAWLGVGSGGGGDIDTSQFLKNSGEQTYEEGVLTFQGGAGIIGKYGFFFIVDGSAGASGIDGDGFQLSGGQGIDTTGMINGRGGDVSVTGQRVVLYGQEMDINSYGGLILTSPDIRFNSDWDIQFNAAAQFNSQAYVRGYRVLTEEDLWNGTIQPPYVDFYQCPYYGHYW